MTQQHLIDQVITATGLSRDAAAKAVQAVLQGITIALGKGEEVRLNGFGVFSVAARPAREGCNPQTGEPIGGASRISADFYGNGGLFGPSLAGFKAFGPSVAAYGVLTWRAI